MSFVRVLACIGLMGGAAACAGEVGDLAGLPPPATNQEVQVASASYASCILDQARRLDDGKGTPIAVALKIVPLCEMQFANLQDTSSRGDDPVTRYEVRDVLKADREEFAASIVQRIRLDRELGP
jgi:hypothetical protein